MSGFRKNDGKREILNVDYRNPKAEVWISTFDISLVFGSFV
tara:strand:+ start:356 stop:478 length:123 start_codon:yes stop_codon:yes gene_type:complete